MTDLVQPRDRLLELIRPIVAAENSPSHLSLEEWTVLLNDEGDPTTFERLGEHIMRCRSCSQILLEAEEYAEKVRDTSALARMTPRYIPDATPSRLILETAGSRVWVERVRGGWLLASMDMDVEVLDKSLEQAVSALSEWVEVRRGELVQQTGLLSGRDRRMVNWLSVRGGKEWTQAFREQLPEVLAGAALKIQALEVAWETSEASNTEPIENGSNLLSEAQIGQMSSAFNMALQIAQTMLNAADRPSDPDVIRKKVQGVLAMLQAESGEVDVEEELLVRELQARYTTYIGSFGILEDHDEKHYPWVKERSAEIPWRFWNRYERLLREKKGWVPSSLVYLDDLTDTVLDRLEDPKRVGAWDRRGVVVGSVQSGKTANYTGLICKAADAGYKLIVVMAGMHNNLRSQTQWRLDEGFLGWDTRAGRRLDEQPNQKIGVGRLRGEPWFTAPALTSNAINGDFNRVNANQSPVVPGGNDPVLLVVKKNKSVLQNVRKWALQVLGEGPEGEQRVQGIPFLLIDDEADNASINTAARPRDRNGNVLEDYNVTAINGEIRKLLTSFEQSAYVGYTATPFANIFIAPDATTATHGKDIFPENFIVNLPTPSNYVGPARVFGLESDEATGIEEVKGLPIIRMVDDFEDAFPPHHEKAHRPDALPDSLKTALRAFILTCAARRARGQKTDHNSMLVHVTRFIDVQREVEDLIKEELAALKRQIEFASGNTGKQLLAELEHLWKTDFEPTSRQMGDLAGTAVTWQQVRHQLHEAAQRIQPRTVNSDSLAALDYIEHPNGLNVIVIGGDKLSRGLTLEGLSVSYYLRATKMYDTLMQMGRWFGYRPGFLDLCRLYTTEELVLWYRHIALADAELRSEFDQMEAIGATPKEYALRVRTHPEGLLVTAINKMRDSVVMRLSYSGRLAEVSHIYRDIEQVRQNLQATESLVNSLGEPELRRGNLVWRSVSGETIVEYLHRLQSHPHATAANSARLAEYIISQMAREELTEWTVALISNTRPDPTKPFKEVLIGRWHVVTSWRDPVEDVKHVYAIRKGHIVNPPDEYLDFDDNEVETAKQETIARYHQNPGRRRNPPTRPSGAVIRELRSPEKGLLILYPLFPPEGLYGEDVRAIIGYAVSFPFSPTAEGVEYRIGELLWRQQIGDDDDDDA